MLERGPDGLFHPSTEAEVVELVRRARAERRRLRVHGARHSEPELIGTEAHREGRSAEAIDVRLDRMTSISIDRERKLARVEAGCRFGADPRERNVDAAFDRSLNAALDAARLALPNLGGISHQTIAGFMMTGSAGGSVRYSFSDALVGLTFVDGTGAVHHLTRGDPMLDAVAVSFGVLGVVTSVELACVDAYDVAGSEQVLRGDQLPFDRDADGATGLEGYLRSRDYARVLWWPQPGVDKWVLWTGARAPIDAAPRKAYEAFPPVLDSPLIPQGAAGWALGVIGRRPWWLGQRTKTALFNLFVPVDAKPRGYRDRWCRALPMDDGMDETLLPTRFTEIWLPLEKTGEILRRLRACFRDPEAAGTFALEIYAAARTELWGSPGYGRDSLRLNFFWFDEDPRDPRRDYFPQFWEMFADLEPRYHWGKLMPAPDAPAGVAARAHTPKLAAILELRARLDPDEIFLSDPWRARLGLGAPPPMRALDRFVKPDRRSLWFPMIDSDTELADRAVGQLHAEIEIRRPADELFAIIDGLAHNDAFVPGFRGVIILDPDLAPERRRFREHFSFMTLDLKMVARQPGRRWAAMIQACSLPLASEMVEIIDFEPLAEGGTRVRWRMSFTPLPSTRWAAPLLAPIFDLWLRWMLRRLKRFAEAQTAR